MTPWKIAGALGGTLGFLLGIVAFFLIPQICTEVPIAFLDEHYECFGVGPTSRAEWGLYIGGAAAVLIAVAKWAFSKPSS